MSMSNPHFPSQRPEPASKNRGLLIAVIVLLIAVIGLAIALVLTLTGDNDDSADSARTVESSMPPAQTEASTPAPETTEAPVSATTAPPAEAETVDPTAILFEQQHRDPNDPYARGDVDAEIVIVQYADYRCGYCALWHVEVKDSLEPYIESGQVRFEFRDHPVLGEASAQAAVAARAAGNQDLFWEYGDALYQDTYGSVGPAYDEAYFLAVAEQVGVPDLAQFEEDLVSTDELYNVLNSREHALSLGITGTPSFIVHDTFVPGALDAQEFIGLVESKLA